jgi:hypothetical protein
MDRVSSDLAERYGTERPWRRTAIVALAAVLVLAFLGWLAWATWFHANPAVESELSTYKVVDQHEATAVVAVSLHDGTDASCRVRALAQDHTVVGEMSFTPRDGDNAVSVRTERLATSVDLVGCTADGQPRSR